MIYNTVRHPLVKDRPILISLVYVEPVEKGHLIENIHSNEECMNISSTRQNTLCEYG